MNNKGVVGIGLAIFLVVLIAGLVGIGSFLFSGTLRWILIGIGILIGAFWLIGQLIQGEITRQKMLVVGMVIVVGVAFIILGPVVQQAIFSVDSINILNDGDVVRIIATPGVENAIVELSASDINEEISGTKWRVNNGVRISLDLTEYSQIFDLRNTEQAYYQYELENSFNRNVLKGLNRANFIKQCEQRFTTKIIIDTYASETSSIFSIADVNCITKKQVGTRGTTSGGVFDGFRVEVNANGRNGLITREEQTLSLDGGNIKISFQGSLKEPQGISSVPFDVLYKNGQAKYLIESDAISQINGFANDYENEIVGDFQKPSNVKSAINNYNGKVASLLNDNKNDDFAPDVVESVSISGDRLTAKARTTLPVLRIDVKGEFLGIEQLSGEPKLDCNSINIDGTAGVDSSLISRFTIENEGSQKEKFVLSTDCNKGLTPFTISSVTLQSGESKELSISISPGSGDEGDIKRGTCNIKAIDTNSDESDSCTFGAIVEFPEDIDEDVIIPPDIDDDVDDEEELECKFFQTMRESESCGINLLCHVGIGKPKTTRECVVSLWVYILGLVLVLGIIITILLLSTPNRTNGRKKKGGRK